MRRRRSNSLISTSGGDRSARSTSGSGRAIYKTRYRVAALIETITADCLRIWSVDLRTLVCSHNPGQPGSRCAKSPSAYQPTRARRSKRLSG